MELVTHSIGRILEKLRLLIGLLVAGLVSGASVLALGAKAVVLVPALAMAFVMLIVPYSPLYGIVAAVPVNVIIAGPITIVRLLIVFGIFVAFLQWLKGQTPQIKSPWPEGTIALLFFIWVFFSTVAVSQGDFVNRLGGFFIYAVIFFVVLIFVDTLDRFKNVMLTLVIVGFVQVFLVFLDTVLGIVPLSGLQAELVDERSAGEVRVVGASAHPIFLAVFFQMAMVFALALRALSSSSAKRLIFLVALGLFVWGWINAWSRSSWIGMAVMIGVAALLWSRATRIAAITGGTVGFVILAAHDFSMTEVIRSIESLAAVQRGSTRAGVSVSSESFSWRTENWKAAVSIWASYPFFGVGVDRSHLYMLDHLPLNAIAHRYVSVALPHNMFLQVLVESGVPAFLLFVSLWISAFISVIRSWYVEHLRPYTLSMIVIMCGQATTFFFNPVPREIWLTLALALVLGRMAREHQRSADKPTANKPT